MGLIDRIVAIVRSKSRSKFARHSISQLLRGLAPVPGKIAGDISEHGCRHICLLEVIHKRFIQVMRHLATSMRRFLNFLLGRSGLPNKTVTLVSQLVVSSG